MTTIQPSSHRSWTRVLHDDHDDSFDPRVFWSVNALLLTLLLIFLVWCYRGGAEKISIYLTREAAGLSDAEYLERVRERREREAEEKKETPEQRLQSLKKSFQRNKVHMVSSIMIDLQPCGGKTVMVTRPAWRNFKRFSPKCRIEMSLS